MRPTTQEEKFWRHVDKKGTDECWEWQGSLRKGYGFFKHHEDGRPRKISVHRFSFELHKGKMDAGKQCCHTCDNPKCVNPRHLFEGTGMDNVRDAMEKGRRTQNGELNKSRKLDPAKIRGIRLYRRQKYTQQNIAQRYNVSVALIGQILRGKIWTHVR